MSKYNKSPLDDLFPSGRPESTPPGGSGEPGRRPPTSLEYTYGTSQTLSSVFSSPDSSFEPAALYSDFEYYPPDAGGRYPKRCPYVRGKVAVCKAYPDAYGDLYYRVTVHNLCCDRWDCVPCAKKKRNRILARLSLGGLVKEAQRLVSIGCKYPVKMFTLTAGGNEYRAKCTQLESVEHLRANWNKLNAAMKKKYGGYHYLMVVEPHRDGWPHLHVMIVGEGVAKAKPLKWLKDVWQGRYDMGFVYITQRKVRNEQRKSGYEKHRFETVMEGIEYMTKYMAKGLRNYGMKKKLWSCSVGALANVDDLVIDYGFPVFVQMYRESKEDECLDLLHRRTDSYELMRTRSVDEIMQVKAALSADDSSCVFDCRVNADDYNDLKKLYKGALLPKRYIKKSLL